MLEVRIDKRLGEFRLNVDFQTGDGCMGILGASGSGKSMILKCIAGIETPDRGRIAVNGRVLFDSERGIDVRPQARRVGYLFQNYALFPHMTVARNIGVGIRRPAAEAATLTADLMRRFRLEGMGGRYPDQLSGGQQQRAALARMLAAEPEVILLDEPFSALDPHLREAMQMEMLDSIRDHRDVVLVTHSRDEAYRMCPELAVLDDGVMCGRGATASLFRDPGNVAAARVTGCKNLSRLERLGDKRFRALDWGVTLEAERPVPEWAAHVGIRAHEFEPVFGDDAGLTNIAPVLAARRVEDLFEWNVVFRAVQSGGELWWKYSKYSLADLPGRVRFPPEALLFLR